MNLFKELQLLEKQKYITLRPNDNKTLWIANYTPKVQFLNLWIPLLKKCRGLIVDNKGRIIQQPFEKFFNYNDANNVENLGLRCLQVDYGDF